MRSFTEPPGLMYSSLASTVAAPAGTSAGRRARGVCPTRSRTVGYSRAMRRKLSAERSVHAPAFRSQNDAEAVRVGDCDAVLAPVRIRRLDRFEVEALECLVDRFRAPEVED